MAEGGGGGDGQPAAPPVTVCREPVVLPTYAPGPADVHPQFIEKRVYPLPFIDSISTQKKDQEWDGVWLDNGLVRVLVLPQLGGRIHVGEDLTNGYNFFYRQRVIKPALVGLAGPWASGGVEFNWPQHHRPSTFMPCDVHIEQDEGDGSVTVWCSEHEPMQRMKGMHGVRLRPGSSLVEVAVRLYNRTPLPQTFLWWANAGVHVNDRYQSFFPPDVRHVADHAKRAVVEFPLCRGRYYGINYSPGTRLDWYKNIPVPTSYMAIGTDKDFFGGYDHGAKAGLVHVADHHIAPGKKQWTWGNHAFGHTWDQRNLTDEDGSYIELMAGVYTDNQPDFSWLAPGEEKAFSQFWYPLREIGPAQHANLQGALSLSVQDGEAAVGVHLTSDRPQAVVSLLRAGADAPLLREAAALGPAAPLVRRVPLPPGCAAEELTLRVEAAEGGEVLLEYSPEPPARGRGTAVGQEGQGQAAEGEAAEEEDVPAPATEPPPPAEVASCDELYMIGLHLEQYRHPTRSPTLYWSEALSRDPGDARCNAAMGLWHLRLGEAAAAAARLRVAVARLTCRNPNPSEGQAHYGLGLALRWQQLDAAAGVAAAAGTSPAGAGSAAVPGSSAGASGGSQEGSGEAGQTPQQGQQGQGQQGPGQQVQGPALSKAAQQALEKEAYAALFKATWLYAWRTPAHYALAQIDASRGDWAAAARHCRTALATNAGCAQARNLCAAVLRRAGRAEEAAALVAASRAADPLDWWAAHLEGGGEALKCDTQAALDVALDYADAGLLEEALDVLQTAAAAGPGPGTAPLVHYYAAWCHGQLGQEEQERESLAAAAAAPPELCFPARPQEQRILAHAVQAAPQDARARFYLGCWLYDRRRYDEAIELWEAAVGLAPDDLASAYRCLGIAYFNNRQDPERAAAAYERAQALAPADSRLLYESDQLAKRRGVPPAERLAALEQRPELVRHRDALAAEACALYCQAGRPEAAAELLAGRRWQPWEGGEGMALGAHVRAQLALGRAALGAGRAQEAAGHFRAALESPENLGEAKHLLANDADVHYWLGVALEAAGQPEEAAAEWGRAAALQGDFQDMAVQPYSEQTLWSALALRRLGREEEAHALLESLLEYAQGLATAPAKIDYFATSLPTMLLFHDDLALRQETKALFLEAQARWGLGQAAQAAALAGEVLRREPSHGQAADLLEEMKRERDRSG